MLRISDQLNRSLAFEVSPNKIVSLVPSLTELLFHFGLEEKISGVTRFCIHPRKLAAKKTKVGGSKTPDLHLIANIQPDLIIANKEENRKEDIEWLESRFPVYISDVINLPDAYKLIRDIGTLFSIQDRAAQLIDGIDVSIDKLAFLMKSNWKIPPKLLYLIWKNPYMIAAGNTFINEVITRSGCINAGLQFGCRYPKIRIDEIIKAAPDYVLLSSEPFKFNEKHKSELEELIPLTKIILVDGSYFSWYGSRLLYSAHYITDVFTSLRSQSN